MRFWAGRKTLYVIINEKIERGVCHMKKGTIKEIGPQAIDSQERMIIFFGEEATDTLREYSVIQTIPDSQALVVKKEDQITFGDQTYQVQYVGTVANQILQTIQHVTFVFDEVPAEEPLSSAIYLTPTVLPNLEVGMQVAYN
jgi:PTS system glucitol/sorbitol-specific IIA component